jgi:hypothetical protein
VSQGHRHVDLRFGAIDRIRRRARVRRGRARPRVVVAARHHVRELVG